MADQSTGGTTGRGVLSPYLRARLTRLLTAELIAARDSAIAEGTTPARLAEIVSERRRVIRAQPAR